jgi:DNA-binding XRE family transcriptional regulator
VGRREVPHCTGDLIGWREQRQLTQAGAAEVLGVSRSTIERTEGEDLDTPLGHKLQRALLRYAEHMEHPLGPVPPRPPRKRKRGRSPMILP